MLMGSSYAAADGNMFPPESSSARRGGGKKSAAEQKAANKQPQRGLGVAQLEKIRLHNQMMAAYRSGIGMHHQDDGARIMPQQVPLLAAPISAELMMAGPTSPFQPSSYHTATPYYGSNLQAYSSSPSPPPSLFAHDVRDSSGRRLGQQGPPQQQQHYWVSTSDECSSNAEALDLELRL